LWKLKVASKIKIFIWKALHGTVPGKTILAARHIPALRQCPVYSTGPEDICQLLFTFPRAWCIWEALGLHDVIKNAIIVDRSGSVVLEYTLCNQNWQSPVLGTLGLQESVVVACWYIWWQRRELEKGESVTGLPRTAFAIQALTSNYGAAAPDSKPPEISWSKPRASCYKLNTDAYFHDNGTSAVGDVLRNNMGEAVAGVATFLSSILNTASAEAIALLKGMELVESLGCNQLPLSMIHWN
jgi:hypothetical protein